MRYIVTTPERRFSGEVAGVAFANGRADVDGVTHARAIRYFLRRGYSVEAAQPEAPAEPAAAPVADPEAGPSKPSKTANKDELVAYVVAELDLSEADAKAKTRVELLDLIDQKENEQ